jgi:hypothetical protein
MPGVREAFPIQANDPHTAMLLIAWEMTKLTLYNRPLEYTDDELRAEYEKNYSALRMAFNTQYEP